MKMKKFAVFLVVLMMFSAQVNAFSLFGNKISLNSLSISGGGVDSCVKDRSCCDPQYTGVCFRTDLTEGVSNPVKLKDIATTTHAFTGKSGYDPKGMSYFHYPGTVWKWDPFGTINANAGLSRAISLTGTGLWTQNFGTFHSQNLLKYEWQPQKITTAGTFSSQFGNGKTEVEVYSVNENIILYKTRTTCTADNCKIAFNSKNSANAITEYSENFWGYSGLRQLYSSNGVNVEAYFIFDQKPDGGYNWDNYMWEVGKKGEHRDLFVAVVFDAATKQDPLLVKDIMQNPQKYIDMGHDNWLTWMRSFEYPSEVNNKEQEKRYYFAIYNLLYNLYGTYPGTTSKWGDKYAMSPGAGYPGVWIWDSFFNAWGWLKACKNKECVNIAMDSLRILQTNQNTDGMIPREVWYSKQGTGWQAPGGWSFAVDQADRRFWTNEFSKEFYETLKTYHMWVRANADKNNDNLFMWTGTNSGWDGSIRWEQGGVDSVDLQAWMILDAEALRNMAKRLGKTNDEAMFEQYRQNYVAAAEKMWFQNFYFDKKEGTSTKSTVMSNAGMMLLMTGAVPESRIDTVLSHMYDTNTLGGTSSCPECILPTTARNGLQFYENGQKTWSGSNWINIQGQIYEGALRNGATAHAKYIKDNTLALLDNEAVGVESYNSNTGRRVTGQFGGNTYVWSDAVYLMMSVPRTFKYDNVDVPEPEPEPNPEPEPEPPEPEPNPEPEPEPTPLTYDQVVAWFYDQTVERLLDLIIEIVQVIKGKI